jgi:hypothetical protein
MLPPQPLMSLRSNKSFPQRMISRSAGFMLRSSP